jgi:hypothetical protein
LDAQDYAVCREKRFGQRDFGRILLVRGLVLACRAAGFAVQEAVVAKADIDYGLAKTAELFALTRRFELFALCAFVFGGTGSGAHASNVAPESHGWNVTEVTFLPWEEIVIDF